MPAQLCPFRVGPFRKRIGLLVARLVLGTLFLNELLTFLAGLSRPEQADLKQVLFDDVSKLRNDRGHEGATWLPVAAAGVKYGFKLDDDNYIEAVLIPEEDRNTLCVSSQVGCAMGCEFCLTGNTGFKRNLRPGEIVGQGYNILIEDADDDDYNDLYVSLIAWKAEN